MTLSELTKYGVRIAWGYPPLFDRVQRIMALARRLVRKHRQAEPAICVAYRNLIDDTVVRHVAF